MGSGRPAVGLALLAVAIVLAAGVPLGACGGDPGVTTVTITAGVHYNGAWWAAPSSGRIVVRASNTVGPITSIRIYVDDVLKCSGTPTLVGGLYTLTYDGGPGLPAGVRTAKGVAVGPYSVETSATQDFIVDSTPPPGWFEVSDGDEQLDWVWATDDDPTPPAPRVVVLRGTVPFLITAGDESTPSNFTGWELRWAPYTGPQPPADGGWWTVLDSDESPADERPFGWPPQSSLEGEKIWLQLKATDCLADSEEISPAERANHTKLFHFAAWIENETPRFTLRVKQVNPDLSTTELTSGAEVCNIIEPSLEVDLGHAKETVPLVLSGVGLKLEENAGPEGGPHCPDQVDGPDGLADLHCNDQVDDATKIHYLRYLLYNVQIPGHRWNTLPYHNGPWTLSNNGQSIGWTWYNNSQGTAAVDDRAVALRNLTITAEANGGLLDTSASPLSAHRFWLWDPGRAEGMTPMTLDVAMDKAAIALLPQGEPVTVTIDVYPADREGAAEPVASHVVATTTGQPVQWTWDGNTTGSVPAPAPLGLYVFKVSAATAGGDTDHTASERLTIATDGLAFLEYDENAALHASYNVTYHLTDTENERAKWATLDTIELSPGASIDWSGYVASTPGSHAAQVWQRDLGPVYSYFISAQDNHPTQDRAHRCLPALPHNVKGPAPQASCYKGWTWGSPSPDEVARDQLRAMGYGVTRLQGPTGADIAARLPNDAVMFFTGHGTPAMVRTSGEVGDPNTVNPDYVLFSRRLCHCPPEFDANIKVRATTGAAMTDGIWVEGVDPAGNPLHKPLELRARLVVFLGCYTARGFTCMIDNNPFLSMADEAVKDGVPAAIGFYEELWFQPKPIENKPYLRNSLSAWTYWFMDMLRRGKTIEQAKADAGKRLGWWWPRGDLFNTLGGFASCRLRLATPAAGSAKLVPPGHKQ